MPRLSFRHAKTESIEWTFDRHPDIGEEVVLGDRGVFRVTGPLPTPYVSGLDAEYACELVRAPTPDEIRAALKRGVNTLPSRD
jgi:hypothetical protein